MMTTNPGQGNLFSVCN